MKKKSVLIGLILVSIFSVSSSDAVPLGTFNSNWGGGSSNSELPIGIKFNISFVVAFREGDSIFIEEKSVYWDIITISDVGKTLFVSNDTSNFDNLVLHLTDNKDNLLNISHDATFQSDSPLCYAIVVSNDESFWFKDFLPENNVDLYGNLIESIGLTVNRFEVGISDITGNSYWEGDLTTSIYGEPIPEPATVLVLTFGGLILMNCRIRR